MLFDVFILMVGMFALFKFSDFVVERSIRLSRISGISEIIIGFFLIASATSLPEMAIGILSGSSGNGLIGVGTAIGANIANIAFIFGIVCFFGMFTIAGAQKEEMMHILAVTSAIAFFMLFLNVTFVFSMFLFFIFYLIAKETVSRGFYIGQEERPPVVKKEIIALIFMIFLGIVAVVISANVVTNSAVVLATFLGIPTSFIALTIISIGTTLPELTVSIIAIKKFQMNLVLGNLIGSILANLTLVVGMIGLVTTVALTQTIRMGIGFLLFVNILFYILLKREKFGPREGFLLLLVYLIYVYSLLVFDVILG